MSYIHRIYSGDEECDKCCGSRITRTYDSDIIIQPTVVLPYMIKFYEPIDRWKQSQNLCQLSSKFHSRQLC